MVHSAFGKNGREKKGSVWHGRRREIERQKTKKKKKKKKKKKNQFESREENPYSTQVPDEVVFSPLVLTPAPGVECFGNGNLI